MPAPPLLPLLVVLAVAVVAATSSLAAIRLFKVVLQYREPHRVVPHLSVAVLPVFISLLLIYF